MSRVRNGSHLAHFTSTLEEIEVDWTKTPPSGFETTIDALLDDPAVGVPVPIEDVKLPSDIQTAPAPETIRAAATGVTPAWMGIADYGSVLLESDADGSELMALYPDTHVAVLSESDIVGTTGEAIDELGPLLREEKADVIVATGPSATSDMGAPVRGVHGPKNVHVVIVEQ